MNRSGVGDVNTIINNGGTVNMGTGPTGNTGSTGSTGATGAQVCEGDDVCCVVKRTCDM